MKKIGLISDTHDHLYPDVFRLFEGVDQIFHAGDIGRAEILTELEAIAPVAAVPGNTDSFALTRRLPPKRVIETPCGVIGLTHGHLLPHQYEWPLGLPYLFQEAADLRMIVFGHSHQKLVEVVERDIVLVNPGAAGRPRFNVSPTLAILHLDELDSNDLPRIEHLDIDPVYSPAR